MARTPNNDSTPSDGAKHTTPDPGPERHRLIPHVSVLVDQATGIPWGLDTLVGWAVPEGPAEVIEDLAGLAPDPGVRAALGARLRHRVLRQLAIVDPLSPVRAVRIVFRLTAVELVNEQAADDFLDEIRVWGLDPADVAVVITDVDRLIDGSRRALGSVVARLERFGVAIGLDLTDGGPSIDELDVAPDLVVDGSEWSIGGRQVRPADNGPVALSALIARRDLLG